MDIPGELIPIVLFIMIGLSFVLRPIATRFTTQLLSEGGHQSAALPAGGDRLPSSAPRY